MTGLAIAILARFLVRGERWKIGIVSSEHPALNSRFDNALLRFNDGWLVPNNLNCIDFDSSKL